MSSPPTIETDDRGRPVVVKTGTGALAERRRREAAFLRRAQHPGVVQLLEVRDRDGEVELRVDHVAGPPLGSHPPLAAERLARVGAAVAATLSDLHQLGIVHGNISPEHILVTSDGRVVLCGFADAAPLAEGDSDDTGLAARVDVVQLGRMLLRLLDASVEADATPPRSAPAEHLRRVADDAADPCGPIESAAELARRLGDVAGTADTRRDGRVERRSPLRGPRRWRARPLVLGACIGAGAVAVIAATFIGPRLFGTPGRADAAPAGIGGTAPTSPEREPAAADRSAGAAGASATPQVGESAGNGGLTASAPPSAPAPAGEHPATTAAGELVLPASPSCPEVGQGPVADVDGDGCEDPWQADPGGLEAGGRRYLLGGPDDLVAVGDWDCDGTATPALVERSTGSVFLFGAWASEQADVTVTAAGVVAGPAAVDVVGDTCEALVVRSDAGTTHTFDHMDEAR